MTRRLTLTGGLRYLFETLPTIQRNFATNFVPALYNPSQAPIVNTDGTITPTPNYNPLNGLVFNGVNGVPLQFTTAHQNNLAPTVGFAYDVFGDGKTSLRGGVGIIYTSIPTGTDCALSCTGNPPIIQNLTLVTPSFPNPIGAAAAPPGAPSLVATANNFYPTTGTVTYSLSAERQFSNNWFLSVAGAGNNALHGMGNLNINQPLPDGPYDFNPIINTGTVFPNVYSPYLGYGSISQVSSRRGLIVLVLASTLHAPGSADASVCGEQPAFQELFRQGGNARLGYAERKAAYERSLEVCPSRLDTYHLLALLMLQHGDFGEALRLTRRGLGAAPDDPQLNFDEAVALLSEGHPEESLAILNRLPNSAQSQFYQGMAHRALGDHRMAQQAFSKALNLGYQDPYVLYVLIEQDRGLHEKEKGLEDFQVLDQRFPDSSWLHMVLGDAHLSRFADSDAKGEYQRALELNPQLPTVHFQLGYIAFTRAEYSQAAEEFRKEMAVNPGFSESCLYLGMSLRRLGKNGDALPPLKRALALDPNSVLAYSALAAAEREANQIDAALETLRAGKKQFPMDSSLPAQLVALLKQIGQPHLAEEEASLAQSLSRKGNPPGHANDGAPVSSANDATGAAEGEDSEKIQSTTHAVDESEDGEGEASASSAGQALKSPLADLRLCLERHNAACATAALAAIRDPKQQQGAEYIDLKARALALKREEEEALAANERVIEANPTQPQYLVARAHIYQKFGDHLAAIECFLQAAKLEPESPEPLYFIASSFFLLAERLNSPEYYDRAEQNLKAALRLSPDYDRAEFMLGVIAAMQARLNEAQTYLQQAIRIKPTNPYYHLHYGILLKRLGDDAAAMKEMDTAERLDPSYAFTHYELGSLYEKVGNYPQARTQLESATELDPELSAAYYHLRGVYQHLGLSDQSKRAYDQFKVTQAHDPEEMADPAVAAISMADIEGVRHQP